MNENNVYDTFRKYATVMASTQDFKLFVESLTKEEPSVWNLYSDIYTGNKVKPENNGLLTQLINFINLSELNKAPLDSKLLQKFLRPKEVNAK